MMRPMSDAPGVITVQCTCGAKLKAPASAAGRKAKCPKCLAMLTIAAPPAAGDSPDELYDLAGRDAKPEKPVKPLIPARPLLVAAPPGRSNAMRCPSCRATMPAGSVLCTACGFDLRTGKKLGAAGAGESS